MSEETGTTTDGKGKNGAGSPVVESKGGSATRGQGGRESGSESNSGGTDDELKARNAEAARYRVERNAAREESQRLSETVEALQIAAVAAALNGRVTPTVVNAYLREKGEDISAVLTEDGTGVDTAKLDTVVAEAIEQFGLGPGKPEPNKFLGGTTNDSAGEGNSFVDAFKL